MIIDALRCKGYYRTSMARRELFRDGVDDRAP
jgi:hypothetical protein